MLIASYLWIAGVGRIIPGAADVLEISGARIFSTDYRNGMPAAVCRRRDSSVTYGWPIRTACPVRTAGL
jgi:hypothetical protein